MKPKVLFVSRERFRLPLAGAQRRKWEALASVVDHRVLAAAAPGSPTRDEHFRLVGRAPVLDGPLFYLLLPLRIARQLRDFRPDAALVQGVHEVMAFLIARAIARVPTKVVLDVQGDWRQATRLYGSPWRRLLNPVSDALPPVAVRRVDAVRTVSTETTALVLALGVEPAAVFPSFVDSATFVDGPPAPLPERPRVLFVGVLESVKGFDTLAAAWPAVAAAVPGVTLALVGDGSLRATAEALVRDHGVEWSRRLEPTQVAAAMDDSWLVCLPSRSEGLPRVALEACARGRALVGGDRAGIPDVVAEGVNGFLVDPDDAGVLSAVLVRVLSDRQLASSLGAAARRIGEERVTSPQEYARAVLELVRP